MQVARLLTAIGCIAFGFAACAEGTPTPPLPADDDDGGSGGVGNSSGGVGGTNNGGGGGSSECVGKAGGAPCGDQTTTECDTPDTCSSGICAPNYAAVGVACGDPAADDCDRADSCDGAGSCDDNLAPADASCGDTTDTDCLNPDVCDGVGTCLPDDEAEGSQCDDCPAGSGHCNGCASGACQDACTPVAAELLTSFGGNSDRDGYMFDVVAKADLTITSVAINLETGSHTLAVYYRNGTHVGHETSAADWTLVGQVPGVVSNGPGVATPVPVALSIAALDGATVAIYVTATTSSMTSAAASTVGSLLSEDANLQILVGIGAYYAFNGVAGTRAWNGRVYYQACP